jgi:DNA-binding CsgD family transcriptional regulator
MVNRDDGVTRRQRQVFQLIADGRHPKQVAFDLEISRATVNQHIKLGKKHLDASSTSAAVAKLLRRGEIR